MASLWTPDKIQSILDWPVPINVKGVRGFLGLTGFPWSYGVLRQVHQGVWQAGTTTQELTKKDNFNWGPETQQAFQTLKLLMTSAPVLALPNFLKPFEIECDASGRGLGAVLMQEKQPIAFYSRALSTKTLAKFTYEKEIMALAISIQHWRPYLLGRTFTVFTDQKSLKHLLEQRITTPDQQNWLAKLMGYHFSIQYKPIQYKPGRENRAADALSRIHEGSGLLTMVSTP